MEVTSGLDAAELRQVAAVTQSHRSFIVWRATGAGVHALGLDDRQTVSVGRRTANDVAVPNDPEASRAHARFERLGDDWLILDDGISRNGTFVNGMRVGRHQRLEDGDQVRVGSTVITFYRPPGEESSITAVASPGPEDLALSPMQRRILAALCRPYHERSGHATPASNREIAAEVFLGIDAVKAHLRELYRRFNIQLPPVQKRVALAQLALNLGVAEYAE